MWNNDCIGYEPNGMKVRRTRRLEYMYTRVCLCGSKVKLLLIVVLGVRYDIGGTYEGGSLILCLYGGENQWFFVYILCINS